MTHSKLYKTAQNIITLGHTDLGALNDALDLARSIRLEQSAEIDGKLILDQQMLHDSIELTKLIRTECAGWIRDHGDRNAVELYRKSLLLTHRTISMRTAGIWSGQGSHGNGFMNPGANNSSRWWTRFRTLRTAAWNCLLFRNRPEPAKRRLHCSF